MDGKEVGYCQVQKDLGKVHKIKPGRDWLGEGPIINPMLQ